jgi:hypothetical protein
MEQPMQHILRIYEDKGNSANVSIDINVIFVGLIFCLK